MIMAAKGGDSLRHRRRRPVGDPRRRGRRAGPGALRGGNLEGASQRRGVQPRRPKPSRTASEGQRSVEELVDRYQITNAAVRDLLVAYLKERQPALDYTSLRNLSLRAGTLLLGRHRAHQPGIDTLPCPVGSQAPGSSASDPEPTIMRTSAGETVQPVERLATSTSPPPSGRRPGSV